MQELIARLVRNSNIRVFLFSNVVPPFIAPTVQRLKECYPQLDIDNSYFASSRDGFGKGIDNNEAFSYLLKKVKPSGGPQAVVFIDDNESYTTAARSLFGIRGLTFRGNPYINLTAAERLEQELGKAELITR